MNIKINSNKLIFLSLLSLCLIQYYLFKSFVKYEIINFYPANYDQTSYLLLVYHLFENIKTSGFHTIFLPGDILPTGILFPLQALLSFFILGANRFSALLPNFLYFIIMQITVFFTAKKLFGSYSYSFILLGLILTLNTPFWSGGIVDFRMDFLAFNLYGILTCLFLLSQNFLLRQWVIYLALTVVLLILLRFITFIFLLPIACFLVIQFTYSYRLRQNIQDKLCAKKRLINLLIFFSIILIFIVPCFIITGNELYQYYVISHLSEKQFRSVAHHSIWQFIKFYPTVIKNQHIGHMGKIAIKLLIAFAFLTLILRQIISFKKNYFLYRPITMMDLFTLLLLIACPILILMLDPVVSFVVCGIVGIPLLLLLVSLFFYMTYPLTIYWPLPLNIVASFILILGLIYQWQAYVIHREKDQTLKDSANITQLYENIGNYAIQHHWSDIKLSMDFVTDYLNYGSFITLYYEKNGKLLTILTERMGSDLFSPLSKEQALASLKASNVVILTVGKFPDKKQAFFPGIQSIAYFRPQLAQYTTQHFSYFGHYVFKGYEHNVYVAR